MRKVEVSGDELALSRGSLGAGVHSFEVAVHALSRLGLLGPGERVASMSMASHRDVWTVVLEGGDDEVGESAS